MAHNMYFGLHCNMRAGDVGIMQPSIEIQHQLAQQTALKPVLMVVISLYMLSRRENNNIKVHSAVLILDDIGNCMPCPGVAQQHVPNGKVNMDLYLCCYTESQPHHNAQYNTTLLETNVN